MAERQVISKEFNVYQASFASLAAGASASSSITVQSEADFLLQKLTFFADIAAAAQTDSTRIIPLITILITDSGTKRQLMSAAVPVASIFGTGEIPFLLPQPKAFKARSSILIQASNYSVGSTYNLYLSFIGTDIYYAG